MEEKKTSEIDVIRLISLVLKKWRLLSRFAATGMVIGIIVAFSIPKQFSTNVILAPEFSAGSMGISSSLSDLASSFGVNLNSGNNSMDAIYPDLYPYIFESTDFVQSLYDVPVRLQKDATERSYLTHLKKDTRMPWWDYPKVKLIKWLSSPEPLASGASGGKPDPYVMNRTQWEIYNAVSKSISCIIDKKTSVINISVTDQDPMVAAIIADTLQQRLQHYITNYRTAKARIDVEHYQELALQAKEDYDNAREKYVAYYDSHMEASLMAINSQVEDMENDVQLKYNIYTQSMTELKMAEAKLLERIPAFTVLQPAKVNTKPVSMPKILIMFIWIFLSLTAGIGYVLYQECLKNKQTAI